MNVLSWTYSVFAKARYTLEYRCFTGVTCPFRWTSANEAVSEISTGSAMFTWIEGAFVDLRVAH